MNVSVFNALRAAYERLFSEMHEIVSMMDTLQKELDTRTLALATVQKEMDEIGEALNSHRPGTTEAVKNEIEARCSYLLRLDRLTPER